eukprot:6202056-Pleurochrysis_carterae.AAC.1
MDQKQRHAALVKSVAKTSTTGTWWTQSHGTALASERGTTGDMPRREAPTTVGDSTGVRVRDMRRSNVSKSNEKRGNSTSSSMTNT